MSSSRSPDILPLVQTMPRVRTHDALRGARCLVLGGRGFVGSAFCAEARAIGIAAEAAGREDLGRLDGRDHDLVVFAAGNARRYLSDRDPATDLDASVGAVYRALRGRPLPRFVLISTLDVYAEPARIEASREDAPIDPLRLTRYGFHKRMAELVALREVPGCLIVRLGQMVGPGLRKGPIFDALEGRPLRVSTRSRYPLLRTRSVAAMTFALIAAGASGIVNVCARDSVELAQVLELLAERQGVPPRAPEVEAGAPEERYEIDVGVLSRLCEVPSAEDEARAFATST